MILSKIVDMGVFALFLAAYDVYFIGLYKDYLTSVGRAMGVGEAALGYFIVFVLAWVIGTLITRRMKGGHD